MTEPDEHIAAWKRTVRDAVGANGGVLVEVIPGLERIIGPQPAVSSTGPAETRYRLQATFARFARAIAGQGRPLAIFLDDLQWADSSSLALLETLAADPDCNNLMLIGSYRDNEVLAGHPLRLMLEHIAASGKTPVRAIELSPLGIDALTALLSDAVVASRERVQLLATHVLEKTAGNPFFVEQLLSLLEREKIVHFDPDAHAWTWSETEVARLEVAENVAEVVARKIGAMAGDTIELLKICACIGIRIDLPLLAAVWGRSPATTATALTEALVEGLIVPLDESYKYVGNDGAGENVAYRFVHDRVHQAAYSLATETERRQMDIGAQRHARAAHRGDRGGVRDPALRGHGAADRGPQSARERSDATPDRSSDQAQRAHRAAAFAGRDRVHAPHPLRARALAPAARHEGSRAQSDPHHPRPVARADDRRPREPATGERARARGAW